MAWFRVKLTKEEQQVVNEERESHPNPTVRRRMLSLWLLHCGLTREKAAEVAGLGRATVERIVEAYRDGGLDGLRQWNRKGPTSELAAYRDLIRESFEKEPIRTVAEAADRIEKLTGLRRGPTGGLRRVAILPEARKVGPTKRGSRDAQITPVSSDTRAVCRSGLVGFAGRPCR